MTIHEERIIRMRIDELEDKLKYEGSFDDDEYWYNECDELASTYCNDYLEELGDFRVYDMDELYGKIPELGLDMYDFVEAVRRNKDFSTTHSYFWVTFNTLKSVYEISSASTDSLGNSILEFIDDNGSFRKWCIEKGYFDTAEKRRTFWTEELKSLREKI